MSHTHSLDTGIDACRIWTEETGGWDEPHLVIEINGGCVGFILPGSEIAAMHENLIGQDDDNYAPPSMADGDEGPGCCFDQSHGPHPISDLRRFRVDHLGNLNFSVCNVSCFTYIPLSICLAMVRKGMREPEASWDSKALRALEKEESARASDIDIMQKVWGRRKITG